MNENIIWILIFISILFILVVIVKDLFFICDSSDRKILKEKNINAFGDVSRYVARSRETIPDVIYYHSYNDNFSLPSIDKEKLGMGLCVAGGLVGYFILYVIIGILSGGIGFIGIPFLMMFDNK